ncbi:AAA family ATPase [Klebsiella pneumoniae]|uniref:AAA family ATPase n=1 Tax=Klebsiella pneumoniae TaxID=573 RepID=UPI00203C54E3|nr:AAA family ATPase [Klebsiella pneumoniae]MDE9195217.1 AAA family ATPase [Klebsiella pneumoniae]USB57174.1 ATP-binding protein [Klebsiella pneumoniae]
MSERIIVRKLVLDYVEIDIAIEPFSDQGENYYSIITGRNGSGKSRVLEAISLCILFVELLSVEQRENIIGKNIHFPLDFISPRIPFEYILLEYHVGSTLNKIEIKDNTITSFSVISNENANPKLICLSNSFFNRFLEGYGPSLTFPSHNQDKYKNLSINKYVEKSKYFSDSDFVSAVLSREIIKSFFMGKDVYARTMAFLQNFGVVGDIFLSLKVEWRICGANLWGVTDIEKLRQSVKRILGCGPQMETDEHLVSSLSEKLGNLLEYLNAGNEPPCSELEDDHFFVQGPSIADFIFNDDTTIQAELCKDVLYLAEHGILLLKDFRFNRNGLEMDLRKMSSGEINVFLMLIKINSEIENNSIIMIDEPEISLHPAWQNKILPSIESCFSQYNGCHFIIATHSPQVVASIPRKNSCVIMLDNTPNTTPGKLVHGKSSDFQLFHTLNYTGDSNEYLIKSLLTIIAKIDASTKLTNEDLIFIEKAKKMSDDIDDNDTAKYLLLQALALLNVVRG